jgi:4,5-DOPA dioxygenase extradiol
MRSRVIPMSDTQVRPFMPTVFVSHGAPTLALDPGETGAALARLGAALPRPRAIVVLSPHWSTLIPHVGASPQPETIHDFHGFAPALYALRYEPPGAPDVAAEIAEALAAGGYDSRTDARRGLDHGAWVPLRMMYPDADVPTMQLSLQPRQGPAAQFALGRALAPLASRGVLFIASGSLTHNLHDFDPSNPDPPELAYVEPFARWIRERLAAADLDALLDYRARAPHSVRAHPTDEHLLPLFFAMGAADDWTRSIRVAHGTTHGMLAMDAFCFGRATATMSVAGNG